MRLESHSAWFCANLISTIWDFVSTLVGSCSFPLGSKIKRGRRKKKKKKKKKERRKEKEEAAVQNPPSYNAMATTTTAREKAIAGVQAIWDRCVHPDLVNPSRPKSNRIRRP
jgi:hypothetical protein